MAFRFSKHVLEELAERGIPQGMLDAVLASPDQRVKERDPLVCYQSIIQMDGRNYLLRAIVNEEYDPHIVVTAYRTSKIDKYWRRDENQI